MNAERPWAWPLVPLYRAASAAREALRAAGVARQRHLSCPVISVGSLSAGGAGKTPLVIALAKLLTERGWTADVLSRGYRRTGRGVEQVDLEIAHPARRFGDEPTLLARRTGVPVWVGADRYQAGIAAEKWMAGSPGSPRAGQLRLGDGTHHSEADQDNEADQDEARWSQRGPTRHVHLLDDGMQHRALARGFELVLVTAEDLIDTLLPAGNLREPLSALKRAHAFAVREEELAVVGKRLRALAGADVPLWTVRRSLRFPAPLGIFGAGLRPLAFCALARPGGFPEMLAKAGCGVVDTVIFKDHHRYDDRDIAELIGLAKRLGATGLVTTEKDAVKLSAPMTARLEAEIGPLMVAALDAAFVYESPVMRGLESRLRSGAADSPVVDAVRSR